MIAKCANPNCSKPFRYLNDGRLFVVGPAHRNHHRDVGRGDRVRYAWLCQECAAAWTVDFETERGFKVVPLGLSSEESLACRAAISGIV
jgi:hypothetical protein